MNKDYKTVAREASDEFVEKRSRFIGYIKPVKTEEEAVAFINQKRSEHWDARHNVYKGEHQGRNLLKVPSVLYRKAEA